MIKRNPDCFGSNRIFDIRVEIFGAASRIMALKFGCAPRGSLKIARHYFSAGRSVNAKKVPDGRLKH